MELQPYLPTLTPDEGFWREGLNFFWLLCAYFWGKLTYLFRLGGSAVAGLWRGAAALKFEVTRKLLWSRGALGAPVSHLGVTALAVALFLSASLLSGTPLVRVAGKVSASDFIPAPDVLAAPTAPETKTSEFIRKEPLAYVVRSGDTLSSIGAAYRITVDALRFANNLDEDALLKVGRSLSIPPVEGVIHTVQKGDTVASLAKKYEVPGQAIVDFNYLFEPFTLTVGEKIVIPEAKIPPPPPKIFYALPLPKSGPAGPVGSGQFLWPVLTRFVTQYFTYYHNGIDIGGYSPIYAADSGRVVTAGWNPWGLGYHVRLDHGNGYLTTYGHMSRIDVSVGQDVVRGQVIGQTGNTGNSFGTHLHFIIQQGGRYLNPLSFL